MVSIPENHHANPIGNNPLDLATFLWQAGKPAAAGRHPIALKTMGEPCPCAELEGAERAASIERGGNGRVAHFAGNGWYQADCDAAHVLRPSKNAVTLTRLERGGAQVLFAGEGRHAGLEVAGALEELAGSEVSAAPG